MKKVIFTIALLASTVTTQANNFNMPGFGNNNNGFNNGSSWNMPNMNWGNSNNNSGFNNGSNWSMPSMNFGNNNNGNRNGSNWSMPNMNWGNSNNGNNGSNWNMPNMNFGNSNNGFNNANNGSNWSMPNMNWGNNNNNVRPNYNYAPPNVQYMPAAPMAPQFRQRLNAQKAPQVQASNKMPTAPAQVKQQFKAPIVQTTPAKIAAPIAVQKTSAMPKIPMPSEVKGTILAPANQPVKVEATTK